MPINPNAKGEISGESLFGDVGSPEALAMLYAQRQNPPKERFSGLKKLLGTLKKAFTIEAPKGDRGCRSERGACSIIRDTSFRNGPR